MGTLHEDQHNIFYHMSLSFPSNQKFFRQYLFRKYKHAFYVQ